MSSQIQPSDASSTRGSFSGPLPRTPHTAPKMASRRAPSRSPRPRRRLRRASAAAKIRTAAKKGKVVERGRAGVVADGAPRAGRETTRADPGTTRPRLESACRSDSGHPRASFVPEDGRKEARCGGSNLVPGSRPAWRRTGAQSGAEPPAPSSGAGARMYSTSPPRASRRTPAMPGRTGGGLTNEASVPVQSPSRQRARALPVPEEEPLLALLAFENEGVPTIGGRRRSGTEVFEDPPRIAHEDLGRLVEVLEERRRTISEERHERGAGHDCPEAREGHARTQDTRSSCRGDNFGEGVSPAASAMASGSPPGSDAATAMAEAGLSGGIRAPGNAEGPVDPRVEVFLHLARRASPRRRVSAASAD